MSFLRFVGLGALLVALAAPARADESPAEVFVDKGETFARAGSTHGLTKGEAVTIVGPAAADGVRKVLGTAAVLEVWPAMARISLDKAAQAAGDAVFVQLAPSRPSKQAPRESTTTTAEAGNLSQLKGRASVVGFGPFKQLRVTNESASVWTDCDVRFANNKRFQLAKLSVDETEGIALYRFVQDGTERDVPLSSVALTCKEGRGTFQFSL